MRNTLLVELKRPGLTRLLAVYGVLVASLLVVVLTLWLPAREATLVQQHALAVAEYEGQLRDNLGAYVPRVQALDRLLPDVLQKLEWTGQVTEYSSAVQDAAVLSDIALLEETNEIERKQARLIYRKTLNFHASHSQLATFLERLGHLEMLVVPSSISVQAGSPLAVTLELTTFSGNSL